MQVRLRPSLRVTLVMALALISTPVFAHEFWIAPERGQVASGETITADLKVGQRLKGQSYPYLSDRFEIFTDTLAGEHETVTGLEGDIPAFSKVAETPGLHVIAQQTIAFRVTYDDWTVFHRYLADEGLERFVEQHRSRGLPESEFSERYKRYAKALVQVGPTRAADRETPLGMALELVTEANPYAKTVTSLPVRLLWQGMPLANQQINVFHDNRSEVKSSVITDAAGRAQIPLAGAGSYLLNAVHLEPVENAPVVWSSHWASLSFRL